MADFPESVKAVIYQQAGGRCQCRRQGHGHDGARCGKSGTHYHHITAESVGGGNTASNCELLCADCHRLTPSYGRH
jgi:5-methylcytosine-specific restriction endonuclease McrA